MSTLRVNTVQNTAGSGPPVMSGTSKAWANIDGTGTIALRESFNVSSLTDNAVGRYTVNFTTAVASANFCAVLGWNQGATAVGGVEFETGNFCVYSRATTSVTVVGRNDGGAATDNFDVNVAVFL